MLRSQAQVAAGEEAAQPAGPASRRLLNRPFAALLVAWLGIAVALGVAIGATGSLSGRDWTTEAGFFWRQDLPVLAGFVVLTGGLGLAAPLLSPLAQAAKWPARGWIAGLTAVCFVASAAGVGLVFANYAFSLDEFLANFDARIFASGRFFAPVPAAWRDYTGALQPIYMLPLPPSVWASSYLPVNAALRALGSLVGAEGLVNPALGAVSIVAVWGVARRLWPDRPQTALIAAALLATAPQLIVMSMTAYAMPAHLAFNLVWLWLYLRGGRLGHAGALATGFLATGLHQLIFHPIFAAPFILQLWIERRWRVAALYTISYALICGFWLGWLPLEMRLAGVQTGANAEVDADWLSDRISDAFDALKVGSVGVFAECLARFVTWQNPLTVPLAVAGSLAAFLAKGPLRSLVLGVALTCLAMAVASPTQTHGWGYRYLHGLMGSFALVAAWTWSRWSDRWSVAVTTGANGALVAACALSLLIFVPLRAWQAWAYVRPYAAANAAIQSADTDVVVVDHNGEHTLFDMGTLVRNDPFLRHSPKVVALVTMPPPLIRRLCAEHSVLIFNHVSASSYGVDVVPWHGPRRLIASRALMAGLGCGALMLAPRSAEAG